MNTHILNSIRPLHTAGTKADCFKHLTFSDKHLTLCHNTYASEHINMIIEESDYIILHFMNTIENIVGFALLKMLKHRVLDVLLICDTLQNEEVTHSVYSFAVSKKCKKIYTAPHTPALRKTFMKYGFEHLCGVKDMDEVLVKEINPQKFARIPKTLKININTVRVSKYNSNCNCNNSSNSRNEFW